MKYVAKKPDIIEAWKYEKGTSIPVWVARRCHNLGDGELTANTVLGPLTVDLGDYVVLLDVARNAITVVNGKDFEKSYRPEEPNTQSRGDNHGTR